MAYCIILLEPITLSIWQCDMVIWKFYLNLPQFILSYDQLYAISRNQVMKKHNHINWDALP